MISAAVGRGGETLISAQTTEAFWNAVQHVKPLSVGLNCSLGPDLMYPFLEELSEKANVAISAYPNAGCPIRFRRPASIWARRTWPAIWATSRAEDSSISPEAAAAIRPNTSRPSPKRSKECLRES